MASGSWSNGSNGSGTWDVTNGVLTISGTGKMTEYTPINPTGSPWYPYLSSVTSIVIKSGITTIGGYSFYNFSKVTSVSIEGAVTFIGTYAFKSCMFTSIELPNTLKTIGSYAFYYCSNLTSIELPDSVTDMGYVVFGNCVALVSAKLSSGLTTLSESTFKGCTALTSVIIPEGVTTIEASAFRGCTALTSITFLSSSAPPTLNANSLSVGESSQVTITVYTNGGWGSDDVFTSSIRGNYTTFIYKRLGGAVTHVNVSGTWKESTPYVNVNGTWKEVVGVYANVGGTWKEVK